MATSVCTVPFAVQQQFSKRRAQKKDQPKKKDDFIAPAVTLFPAQDIVLGWRNQLPVGAGMVNLGNTCYVNSTLQALFHTPAFVNWLQSDQCNGNSGTIISAMARTLKSSHSVQGAMRPHLIIDNIQNICRTMKPGQQEDAHEFLRHLLQGMERAYLDRRNTVNLDARSKETTPINQIFGGYIRTEVKCPVCTHVSTTIQHFQDITVDIFAVNTVGEALDAYFRPEEIDDYRCEGCQNKVLATKKFSVVRMPKVLCLQLQRFTIFHGKLTRHIGFDDHLNVGPYVDPAPSASSKLYKLKSIISHVGQSANSGHYVAAAQASNGQYHLFDDQKVRTISRSSFLGTNAYLMFFELEERTTAPTTTPAASPKDFMCEDPALNAIVMAEFQKMALSDNSVVALNEDDFPALGGGRKPTRNTAPKPQKLGKKPFKKRK